MARHSSLQNPTAQRALIALAATGAALGAGAATASAAEGGPAVDVIRMTPTTSLGQIDPQSGLAALTGTVGYVTGPVAGLKPNPLAGTGVDPLDNGVGTQLADFQPVASQMVTGPVAQAQSIGRIPVLGEALGVLGG
ncbi:hypothetical protein ACKI1I_18370 [Streptomyces turgidiscabies]|uniref:Secreted protein n=1 Tax=Streptomyces turgidiscabies (strain Car8) TaxID=698760 RepID=L7EQ41_STRT8|nr:hypothetical protein [Streptomyces turgidiscabies]ELP61573.1 hypothetical protein STRTUCAR8_07016 [Streptomyces turgidiscabies Car8]MDX3497915.1 hypothetical protein [Streptomyces turgidiscabies]GAQ69823.1 hypothetical protein T45_01554 [Streptomyces turgidiscabies]